jgi:hypothetical protein
VKRIQRKTTIPTEPGHAINVTTQSFFYHLFKVYVVQNLVVRNDVVKNTVVATTTCVTLPVLGQSPSSKELLAGYLVVHGLLVLPIDEGRPVIGPIDCVAGT